MSALLEAAIPVVNTVADVVGRLWPLIVAVGAILGGLRFFARKLRETIAEQIAPLAAELSPNGGSSMNDRVARVDAATQLTVGTQAEVQAKLEVLTAEVSGAGARVRALRSSTDHPYVEMDADLKHTFVNKAYSDLFGVAFEDAVGELDWESRVHPDDVYRLKQTAEMLREHPQPYVTESRVLNRRDGVVQRVVAYGYPIFGPYQVLSGYAAAIVLIESEPMGPVPAGNDLAYG